MCTLSFLYFSLWDSRRLRMASHSLGMAVSASSVPKACSKCAMSFTVTAKLSMACNRKRVARKYTMEPPYSRLHLQSPWNVYTFLYICHLHSRACFGCAASFQSFVCVIFLVRPRTETHHLLLLYFKNINTVCLVCLMFWASVDVQSTTITVPFVKQSSRCDSSPACLRTLTSAGFRWCTSADLWRSSASPPEWSHPICRDHI